MNEPASCMVKNCNHPSSRIWLTHPALKWTVGWLVCHDHHAELQRGADYCPINQQGRADGRWLLMGDALTAAREPQEAGRSANVS